eukprot:12909777-Prorocentrum_lima.AAC.1
MRGRCDVAAMRLNVATPKRRALGPLGEAAAPKWRGQEERTGTLEPKLFTIIAAMPRPPR